MAFCPWESRNSHNWDSRDFGGPITLRENLRLRWGLKKHCSPCWELSKGMLHASFTRGNQSDFGLLVVDSQIGDLTFGPSFNHNLCFICPNVSCEPISDIYVLRNFQWYKKIFSPLGLDPCNYSLKIWKSIGTPTPKVGIPLGVWRFIPSHSLTLSGTWDVTLGLPLGPPPCKPLPCSQAQG
jgi:hypothetical protein